MERPGPRLPLEVIFHVIDELRPEHDDTLLPPWHPSTKALVAFARVCRGAYPLAAIYLMRHCAYINTQARLRQFLLSWTLRPKGTLVGAHPGGLQTLTSLYLGPFGESLYDLPTATWTSELFHQVCGTLKRLVIDMPLRSLYPAEDRLGVRKTLREAFAMLTKLEEFVSVRDELFLGTVEPDEHIDQVDVWTLWPELRRMALYNPLADSDFWYRVAEAPKLESLVLTRADALGESCMKTEYLSRTDRPLKLVVANVLSDHCRVIPRSTWDTVDPSMKMRVLVYNVPTAHDDEDPIGLCQSWVKKAALSGTLWEWDGHLLKEAPLWAGLNNSGD